MDHTLVTVGELAASDVRLAAVLERFGIDICRAKDRTLADACRAGTADPERVVAAIEALTVANAEHDDVSRWPIPRLIDFIVSVHHAYVRSSMPALTRHLTKLMVVHGDRHPELARISAEFDQVVVDLTRHMLKEEQVLFPYIPRARRVQRRRTNAEPVRHGRQSDQNDGAGASGRCRCTATDPPSDAGLCRPRRWVRHLRCRDGGTPRVRAGSEPARRSREQRAVSCGAAARTEPVLGGGERSPMTRRFLPVVLAVAAISVVRPAIAAPTPLMPPDWDAALRLADARDINPDPEIVEVNLTARLADVEVAPGNTVHAWTYNGSIPGPLIRAHVGDRLIVHFTNQLAAADDRALARRARADRDGRRAGRLAARGEARRHRSPTTSSFATPGCTGITRT